MVTDVPFRTALAVLYSQHSVTSLCSDLCPLLKSCRSGQQKSQPHPVCLGAAAAAALEWAPSYRRPAAPGTSQLREEPLEQSQDCLEGTAKVTQALLARLHQTPHSKEFSQAAIFFLLLMISSNQGNLQ